MEGGFRMKKALCFMTAVCLLLGVASVACADAIDLTGIETRETFSYLEDNGTDWVYYQYAGKTVADGAYIELLVADWGNHIEAFRFPELRIFVTTKNNEEIVVQSATMILDGNMFELTLDELELDNSRGACFYMTSEAMPFIKALAAAEDVSVVLYHKDGTFSVAFTASEFALVSLFACDLLDMDFLNHIDPSEASYEQWYAEATPIVSYIFHENVLDEASEPEQRQTTEDQWKAYLLAKLDLTISLPSNYIAYTRGMSAADPALISWGITPAEMDALLEESNYYLEATPDNFRTEVIVTMEESTLEDFSTWSHSNLLGMMLLLRSFYADLGLEVFDMDIFSCDGIQYIRSHIRQDDGGSVNYKIQYYTIRNDQAISLLFLSADDDVTESEQQFMQEVVEKAVFGADASNADTGALAHDAGNFTYTLLEDGNACITGYHGWSGAVAIPEAMDGHSVTSLAVMEENNLS